MNPQTISDWKGMDNIRPDAELGEDVLRHSSNLEFTNSGKLRTRMGYTRLLTGVVKDGFALGQYLIYHRAGWVRAFAIRTGVETDLFASSGSSLAHVVVDGIAYVSDGTTNRTISSDLTVGAWPMVAADDPSFDARFVAPFPYVTKLTYFKGCLVGTVGNVVVYSLPWVYGSINPTQGFFPVRGSVKVLHANDDTLFIGADEVYAVTGLGSALTPLSTVLPMASMDGNPAVDPETCAAYWMTERGIVMAPKLGSQLKLLSADEIAARQAIKTASGIIKRDGVTSVVTTVAPDTSVSNQSPLVARDFLASDAVRKEIYDAL